MFYARHMEIVCDVDKMKVDVQETLKKYKSIKQWAYIIHDKDDTRAHYHIYMHFGKATLNSELVAKWFEIPENFVSKIHGRRTDALKYLTHSNPSQRNKETYDPAKVVANFDFQTEIDNSEIIGDFKNYTYAEQLLYINQLPVSEKKRAFNELKILWDIECQCQTLKSSRNIQVVFISGKGGTGKTTYAKKMLEKLNLDYSNSSSSNDPFQDYKGQKAMILDDLRDNAFELVDLLKILDNNTNSSIKSRFNNKVFNGVMIVITSSVPLINWYPEYKKKKSNENLIQLYRRITDYVQITEDNIYIYDGVDEDGNPKDLKAFYPNYLISGLKKEKTKKIDLSDVFEEISKGEQTENNKKIEENEQSSKE